MKAQAGGCENAMFRRLYEQKRKHGSVFKRLANVGFHQPEVQALHRLGDVSPCLEKSSSQVLL